MNPPTMPWYGSIHLGKMPRWKSAFFDKKNVKGKAEQRKKAVAAHLQIRGDLTDRNVKKRNSKMQADYNALLPYLFFPWIQEKGIQFKEKKSGRLCGQ